MIYKTVTCRDCLIPYKTVTGRDCLTTYKTVTDLKGFDLRVRVPPGVGERLEEAHFDDRHVLVVGGGLVFKARRILYHSTLGRE